MTDNDLIAAMRAGDRRAGNLLARRYHGELHAYFRKRVPPEEADELTQSALLETVGRIERFRGESSFHHYAFSIARRIMADRQRRVSRSVPTISVPNADQIDSQTSPSERLYRGDLMLRVLLAVENLDTHYQSVLRLKLAGENNFEIAETLDVQYNTVRSRLSRAVALIKTALEARLDEFFGVQPPPAPQPSSS